MHSELSAPRPDDLALRLGHVARFIDDTVRGAVRAPLAAMIGEHLGTGGKRTRARLALTAADALGLDAHAALAWAAACELLHNATLVHDDIQDGDRVRRGECALWVRHGVGQAINAGDALLMMPMRALELDPRLPDATRWRLAACLTRRALRAADGQALEMALLERVADLDADLADACWQQYRAAALGKSGQLLAMPFEGAALLAGAAPDAARALGDAIEPLGLLYQIHDDVGGLYAGQSGRERGTDLRSARVTALVAVHLDAQPAARPQRLEALLAAGRDAPEPAQRARTVAAALAADGTLAAVVERGRQAADALPDAPALVEHPGLRDLVAALALHLRSELEATLRRATSPDAP